MNKYFGYNIVDFDEFINLYDFESSINVKSNDKRRLVRDFKAKKKSPLVRAFLVYLKMKDNNDINNNIIEKKDEKIESDESEEEKESSDEEEEGTIILIKPPVKTPVSKIEMERFTKKDFIESKEYKYLVETQSVPDYIASVVNSESDDIYWEGQYNNLKKSYRNLKM